MFRVVLILLAGVTGISFAAIFVRLALPAPPVVTGFYRMLMATGILSVWFLLLHRSLRLARRDILLALTSGLCFGTDLALWQTSIVKTSVASATLLVNTTPVYVGLFSWLVLRQRLHAHFVSGAGLALAGSAILLGLSRSDLDDWNGALMALTAAVFYAGYLLLMTAARRSGEAVSLLYLSSLSATGVLGLYAVLMGNPFSGFPASSWFAMAGAAVVSQIGGVLGIVWALRFVPTTVASVVLLAQPVGTSLLGWWLLSEPLAPIQILGGITVLAGIVLASRATDSRATAPERHDSKLGPSHQG
ncbi:MAG: DMT family transporter [Myxococcales bacterium]|nr:DMT family transporter [Myxococcales bacterium]